jgi:hypothetical protein
LTTICLRKAAAQVRPKKASIFKKLYSPHSSAKDISFINRSFFNIGLVQQPDKIVARFALTIYPYSLEHRAFMEKESEVLG